MSTTNCFSCGNAISDRQTFCTKCGAPAIRKCPRCGAKFAGNVQACSKCGLDAVLMSDAMLVRLAAEQNQTAITKLYEKTYKRYYMICREMLQSRSSGDAEDALQDAYVKMFSSLDKLDDVTKFEAWGATIVRNTCLDILRKNSPVLFDDEALMDAIDYTPTRVYASFEDDPSEYFDQKEVSVLVNQMLLSSPEEQRICIMMYYSQDMSVKNRASSIFLRIP